MTNDQSITDALQKVCSIVGSENFIDDINERRYFSQDYYRVEDPVDAVIQPTTVETLAESVALLTGAGIAVFPRGGGYSYTDAYLPSQAPAVTIDTKKLNRIVEINTQDMFVTVEAGCTWAELDDALKTHGLRTPFFGPLSGRNATLGGGISQGAASLGSGKYGLSAESVVSMDIVLADGSLLKTGSAGQEQHSSFFRHYGPDLTGIFCNDAGALGIKARISMRLQSRKPLVHGLAYGFDSFEDMTKAMTAVSRLNVATENSGMTLSALRRATTTQSLSEDIRIFFEVAKSGPNRLSSIISALKMAISGRRYINASHSSANFVVEAFNKAHLTGQIAVVRKAVANLGVEIPNTLPTVMRAQPFMDYDMLHPDGRRQLPMHTILPLSRVLEFNEKYHALIDSNEKQMEACGMTAISVYSAVSTNGFLFEPVLIWPDTVEEFHRRHTSKAVLKNVKATEPNGPARALVAELKAKIIDTMYACGGVHLQIGKSYPFMRGRTEPSHALVKQLKNHVDPQGLLNPGALGLSAPQ